MMDLITIEVLKNDMSVYVILNHDLNLHKTNGYNTKINQSVKKN